MPETVNKMQIAERLADELLPFFGWARLGAMNQNWRCEYAKEHGVKGASVHTTDAVFWYPNPYQAASKVYFIADLKAWAADNINASAVRDEISKLASTVDCAVRAEHWREHYDVEPGIAPHGLLFIHSTTAEVPNFRGSVLHKLSGVDDNDLPQRSRAYVLGPDSVLYLYSVMSDIKTRHNQRNSPPYSFWHPNLSIQAPVVTTNNVVTIEEFLAPHLVLLTTDPAKGGVRKFVFYSREDWTADADAEFFIDALYTRQLLDDQTLIEFAFPFDPSDATERRFAGAKARFDGRFGNAMTSRLQLVTARRFAQTAPAITEGTTGVTQ